MSISYQEKYLKYKNKYLELKYGGNESKDIDTDIKKIFFVATKDCKTELEIQAKKYFNIKVILEEVSNNTEYSGIFTIIIYKNRIEIYKFNKEKLYGKYKGYYTYSMEKQYTLYISNFKKDLLHDLNFDNFFNLLINIENDDLNEVTTDYSFENEKRIGLLENIINIKKMMENLNGTYYIHSFGVRNNQKMNVDILNLETEQKKIKYCGIEISNINSSNESIIQEKSNNK